MKDLGVGDTIDRRYSLKREIARGGMGIVFEAVHTFTGRAVAIKVVHSEPGHTDECSERLLREARTLAAVRHPNMVEVLDAGVMIEGQPYVVLEMLEGRTLDGILAVRRQLTIADTVHIGRQVCEALAFAHSRGIVHRDVKPGSIFISRNGLGHETVKLFDFGISQVPVEISGSRKLTKTGELLGTPEYMAPEQLLARSNVDHRCDIYAAGITLFECLTGDVPYNGSYPEVLMKVMAAPGPPALQPVRSDVSAPLAAAIAKAMQKDMADRYEDAIAFATALVDATGLEEGSSGLLGAFRPRPGVRTSSGSQTATQVVSPPIPNQPVVTKAPPTAPSTPKLAGNLSREAPVAVRPPATPAPVSAESGRQRRRFVRAPYVTQARIIRPDGGGTLDGRTEDISEGGLLVLTDRKCTDNERIQVRFALPITGTIVTMSARSRWIYTARGRFATGLEFLDLPEESRKEIARYAEIMRPAATE